jgi:hypothetical protein
MVNKNMKYTPAYFIPGMLYPLIATANLSQLQSDINILLSRLGITLESIHDKLKTELGYAINLNHMPELLGSERAFMYNGLDSQLARDGIDQRNFTETLEEIKDLYIYSLIQQIESYHGVPLQGRFQLVWLAAGGYYGITRDETYPTVYHIPIETENSYFYAKFLRKEWAMKMPADGKIWRMLKGKFDSDCINDNDKPRLSIILNSTSEFKPHSLVRPESN